MNPSHRMCLSRLIQATAWSSDKNVGLGVLSVLLFGPRMSIHSARSGVLKIRPLSSGLDITVEASPLFAGCISEASHDAESRIIKIN